VPGERDNADVFHTPVHPEGSAPLKLRVAAAQAELSLSFTVTVKFTAVPEITYWLCKGEPLTVGLDELQLPVPKLTRTVAPVLFTAVGVIVTPDVESV